jgi:hypothetical protein
MPPFIKFLASRHSVLAGKLLRGKETAAAAFQAMVGGTVAKCIEGAQPAGEKKRFHSSRRRFMYETSLGDWQTIAQTAVISADPRHDWLWLQEKRYVRAFWNYL